MAVVAAAAVAVVVGPAAAAVVVPTVAVSDTPVRRDARLQAEVHRRGRGHHHHRDSPVQEIPPHRGHRIEDRLVQVTEHGNKGRIELLIEEQTEPPLGLRIERLTGPGQARATAISIEMAIETSIVAVIVISIAMSIAMSMSVAEAITTTMTGMMPDATGCGIERSIT